MTRARRRYTRLRPRLTLAFALVAALAAIGVAAASYLVVREDRLQRATDAAVQQSRFNLTFAADAISASPSDVEVESLVQSLVRRGGFDVVAVDGSTSYQTSLFLTAEAVPEDLRSAMAGGRVVAARRSIGGRPYVVVGGVVSGTDVELWGFFPLDDVVDDLAALRDVLTAAAVVAVLLSATVGAMAARALLRPIAVARDAAQRVERGDLDTRLPEEGRDEFAELSQSFNAMTAALGRTVGELTRLEAGHRRFVADVSHELRTPVTAMATAADVLEPRLDDLPEGQRRAARVLVAEAQRLRVLVEDLMEISRIDAGAAVVEPDLIDLRRLLLGIVAERGWEADVRTDGVERATVSGDRRRLDRVFVNLLDNALRHGRPPVDVAVTPRGAEVVIEVRDHGPGIPPEHLDRVFERFYKADPARGRTASSGLGLAIARENVVLHGGRIEVGNRADGGASFTVVLPAAATVAEPLPEGNGPVTPAPDTRLHRNSRVEGR